MDSRWPKKKREERDIAQTSKTWGGHKGAGRRDGRQADGEQGQAGQKGQKGQAGFPY